MWVMLMFDLPTVTKVEKRNYVRFTKHLRAQGFQRLQWSVFARPCASEEHAQRYAAEVQAGLPPAGEVRLLMLTDLQFARQRIFFGRTPKPPEKAPEQLTIF